METTPWFTLLNSWIKDYRPIDEKLSKMNEEIKESIQQQDRWENIEDIFDF